MMNVFTVIWSTFKECIFSNKDIYVMKVFKQPEYSTLYVYVGVSFELEKCLSKTCKKYISSAELHLLWSSPSDCSHVRRTTGWFVSDLWPWPSPTPPLSSDAGLSAKTKQRRRRRKKGGKEKKVFLWKLRSAETGTGYLNCWLVLQG